MRHLVLIPAFLALASCGQARPMPACTLAVGARPVVGAEGLPGGFIEIQSRELLSSPQTKTSYCAASVTFERDALRIWTAQHCYRVGLMDSITLHANVGDQYVPIPLSTPDLVAAKTIGASFSPRDPDLASDFVTLLDGASKISKGTSTVTKRCLESSASHRSACFTALDLVAIPATIGAGAPAAAATALSTLKSRFARLAASDLSLLRAYGAAFEELAIERKALAAHAFIGRYKDCVTDRKANAYCSDTYMAESKSVYEKFLNVDAFKSNKNRFAASNAKAPSPFESKAMWQALALEKGNSAREKLAEVWKKLGTRGDLYVSTNLTESKGASTALYAASRIAAKKAEPDTKAEFETIASLEGKDLTERTYILRSPRVTSASVEFSKGDSGSILAVGVVPVAVLSHVDGHETSGGASLIPLPRRAPASVSNEAPRASGGKTDTPPLSQQTSGDYVGPGSAQGSTAGQNPTTKPNQQNERPDKNEPEC